MRVNATNLDTPANTDGTGFYTANRSASNAGQLYRNGASLATNSEASTNNTNDTFNLGRTGGNGTIGYAARQWAACAVGSSLTATEAAAFYSAMLAYMQGVGAA